MANVAAFWAYEDPVHEAGERLLVTLSEDGMSFSAGPLAGVRTSQAAEIAQAIRDVADDDGDVYSVKILAQHSETVKIDRQPCLAAPDAPDALRILINGASLPVMQAIDLADGLELFLA